MTPTEKLKQGVSIPNWALAIIVPAFITIIIFMISSIKVNATNQATIINEVKNISYRLEKVETKLDNHITIK